MGFAVIILVILLYIIFRAVQRKDTPEAPPTFDEKPQDSAFANGQSFSSRIGKDGESEVSYILHSLPEEYLVVDNVTIPDQDAAIHKNHTTQIDHIVVSPFGIFVIETKNYKGWIYGSEEANRWKETFKTGKGYYFYNPIKQNWGHVYALAEHLRLNVNLFKPIVVFSDTCRLRVDTEMPVVYMSQLYERIISYTDKIIRNRNVPLIFDRLLALTLAGDGIETRHVRSIEERYIGIQLTVQENKCPRCGGTLMLRTGKYGAFYGCSNYPKCRFTYNLRSQ